MDRLQIKVFIWKKTSFIVDVLDAGWVLISDFASFWLHEFLERFPILFWKINNELSFIML